MLTSSYERRKENVGKSLGRFVPWPDQRTRKIRSSFRIFTLFLIFLLLTLHSRLVSPNRYRALTSCGIAAIHAASPPGSGITLPNSIILVMSHK